MEKDLRQEELTVIARNWGALADAYAERLGNELDGKPFDREWLTRFAELVAPGAEVMDLGCGPGHVTAHLASLGVNAFGIDLCPEMIATAQREHPGLRFEVGDMSEIAPPHRSLGGVLAFYSLINLARETAPVVVRQLSHALSPGAPLLLAVHHGEGTIRNESVFDQPVPMAATLFRNDEVAAWADDAGLVQVEIEVRPPYPDEYPSERVYLLGRAPG